MPSPLRGCVENAKTVARDCESGWVLAAWILRFAQNDKGLRE